MISSLLLWQKVPPVKGAATLCYVTQCIKYPAPFRPRQDEIWRLGECELYDPNIWRGKTKWCTGVRPKQRPRCCVTLYLTPPETCTREHAIMCLSAEIQRSPPDLLCCHSLNNHSAVLSSFLCVTIRSYSFVALWYFHELSGIPGRCVCVCAEQKMQPFTSSSTPIQMRRSSHVELIHSVLEAKSVKTQNRDSAKCRWDYSCTLRPASTYCNAPVLIWQCYDDTTNPEQGNEDTLHCTVPQVLSFQAINI